MREIIPHWDCYGRRVHVISNKIMIDYVTGQAGVKSVQYPGESVSELKYRSTSG